MNGFDIVDDWAGPAPARQAALLLHGVAGRDRDWLLGELEAGQRAQLERMLVELDALGVPGSSQLAHDLIAVAPRPAAPAAAATPADADALAWAAQITRLAETPVPVFVALLPGEPDGVVQGILKHAGTSQRRAVLRALPTARRDRIKAALDTPVAAARDAGRLDRAIVEAFLTARAARQQALPDNADIGAASRLGQTLQRLAGRTAPAPRAPRSLS